MKFDNQTTTKNPFTIFGTPKKVIVNGIAEPDNEIEECLTALQKHASEIKGFTASYINGVYKLYVMTA